jgi:hypothetical protein
MKSVAIGVLVIVAGLAVYQYVRHASELQQLELTDRCQQMGGRYAEEIRRGDKETGIPEENRDFTYRVHYNTAERKCFVLTEGAMTMPFGRILMTQVWDVNKGVGGPIVAERGVPLAAGGIMTLYRGSEKLPVNLETNKWFANLMIE